MHSSVPPPPTTTPLHSASSPSAPFAPMAADTEAQDSLFSLLKEVQLEHFYHALKAVDVTKVEHFENVVFEDLISPQVGMGAPAARRILEAAKRRNNKWRKNILNIILPAKINKEKDDKSAIPKVSNDTESNSENAGLTCLISSKDIKLLDKLGDGSFGVVMRAQWINGTKGTKYVAVKVLKQEVILRALEDFAKEVNSMHQLKHPNLIKLYGIVLSSPMMMVTELAEQGSLRSKLVKTLGRMSLSTLVDYTVQIANGMEYLETKRLIHRDLATRNIFITESNTIKIGDFGLMRSVPLDEEYYSMTDNMKVPFPWCAIESLKYRQFSHASDTWMYGVTLWEMFSFGQEPWAGLNGSQIIKKLEQNERLSIPNACSQRIYHVMELCWKAEPKDRPTFASMINFFKNTRPIRLKAISDFDNGSSKFPTFQSKDSSEKTYLKITAGDEIEVIEGLSENYWWKGQSQRSFDIGIFPRAIAKNFQTLNHNDISKPLKNSFIHTGHMDPMGKKSWGNPEFIEKMYLEQPIEPPDVLGFETDTHLPPPDLETRGGDKNKVPGAEKKILKISSIDELDDKESQFDSTSANIKEDILIDFTSEIKVEATKAQDSHTNLQDLAEINFETQPDSLLDIDNSPTNGVEQFPSTHLPIELTQPSESEAIKPSSQGLSSLIELSLSSKYYTPPLENSDSQSVKTANRYYSSVCSNCDFTSEVAWNQFPEPPPPSCNCCSEYFNQCTNQCMPNSHCFNSCADLCNPPYPQPYYHTANPVVVPNDFNDSDAQEKPVYQSKICKEFIDELEANFSRLGQIKLAETNDVNSENGGTVYPIINPPPRPYKTRRPAPPPPVQKKVN